MLAIERDSEFIEMERQAYEGINGHKGLNSWAATHEDEELSLIPYEGLSDQRLDRILLPARPNLEAAAQLGNMSLGATTSTEIINSLRDSGLAERVYKDARKGKTTLVASLHRRNVLDTPATHNQFFVALGDPEFAHRNLVVSNYIMSLLKIRSYRVNEAITASGEELRALPAGAEEYVRFNLVKQLNLPMSRIFLSKLHEGVVIHRAPSQTRGKPIELKDGSPAVMVPKIEEKYAKKTVKLTPRIIGVPIDMHFGNSKGRVLDLRELETEDDLHDLMEEMVEVVNEFTEDHITYGLPKGARVIEPAQEAAA